MKKKVLVSVIIGLALAAGGYFFIFAKSKPNVRSVKMWQRQMEFDKNFDSAYIASLSQAGFSSLKEVKNMKYVIERIKWMKEYGLHFLGDEEMNKFLVDNDFIIGDADQYIGDVPPDAGKEMIANFKKIGFVEKRYKLTLNSGRQIIFTAEEVSPTQIGDGVNTNLHWTQDFISRDLMTLNNIPNESGFSIVPEGVKIQIVAGMEKFNTQGMVIEDRILKAPPPPPDPIAIVKVRYGWVQLAGW